MGLTTRNLQSQLVAQDAPHLWEVKIPNHPNGVKQMHCGNLKDAERPELCRYRVVALDAKGANIERLLTGAVGINSEGGEIMEIVKKLVFQGKKWDEETVFHLKRELGDVMWYLTQCLIALDTPIEEIVEMNIDKLKKRYPGGEFEAWYSENRQEGDL